MNRARYRHKHHVRKNFRSRIWRTLRRNESLANIPETKLNKHKNCSCPPAAAEMQLFETQNPPSGGRPANSLTIFWQPCCCLIYTSSDLSELNRNFRTMFQGIALRALLCITTLKTLTTVLQEKNWQNTAYFSLPMFMSTPGAHRRYKRRANPVVILCSENFGPKLVFHTAFREKYFVFPTDHEGQLTINHIFLRFISYNSQHPSHPEPAGPRPATACVRQEKADVGCPRRVRPAAVMTLLFYFPYVED